MLLIIGGERDIDALASVDLFGKDKRGKNRAVLLDARDLSRQGWALSTSEPGSGRIVAGGQLLSVESLTGVLVRRLAVYPQELSHVEEADREYVASEMTALLTWWLHALPVPVVNRPAAGLLCGPGWRPEQWRALAVRLGYPAVACIRTAQRPEPFPPVRTEVVVVGETVAGDPPPHLAERTLALARAANATMLCASFGEDELLLGAHSMPHLTPEVLAALSRYMRLPA